MLSEVFLLAARIMVGRTMWRWPLKNSEKIRSGEVSSLLLVRWFMNYCSLSLYNNLELILKGMSIDPTAPFKMH